MYKYLFFLLLPLVLVSCREDDAEQDLFHITLGTEADAEVAMGVHSAEITINGYARWIEVGIVGEYDSYSLSDDIPDWMTISKAEVINAPYQFRIDVSELGGDDSRTGNVGFTVFKGDRSQSGTITVTQRPCTLEDLKKTERRAMKSYLSKFDVVDSFPGVDDIRVGSVAPFYKLDYAGSVYMQVVNVGTSPAAAQGEEIRFRYVRYNLLSYLENGFLPEGQGNMATDPASFVLGSDAPSTTQWGTAIQMPVSLGLPADSEVNLVVASDAGFASETGSVVPFLYNIRYYSSK